MNNKLNLVKHRGSKFMDFENKVLPVFFNNLLKKQYNEHDINRIFQGYNCQRKVTLRVNTLKSNVSEIKEVLEKNGINFSGVEWNSNAFIIDNSNEAYLQKLNIYENGKIYLQSLSSMLPPIILEPKNSEDILDMAAAPRRKNDTNSCYY